MIAAEDRRMLHRRSTAPAVAALALLVGGAVSACGFEPPTDRVNTIAAGVSDRSAVVDVLGARVLSTAAGEGRLIGALANNDAESDVALQAVSGESVSTLEFDPVTVPAGDSVNLAAADTTPVLLTGDFVAGEVLELQVGFDNGESVTLNVPVVKHCWQYDQVPEPDDVPETADPGEAAEEEAAEEHGGDATYLCDHPEPDAGH